MKDKSIYELINELDLDDTEFEEVDVTEFDKAKVKKEVNRLIGKRKRTSWKMKAAAAVAVCGLSVATLGLAFPVYAGNIPVIGDIFRFLDNGKTGLYDDYQAYSSAINMTRESNGVKITLNDAIYDGKTVSLTYTIESEKDLGDDPWINDFLDIKGAEGMGGSNQLAKVGDRQYVGLITGSNLGTNELDTVKVKWKVEGITTEQSEEKIKGHWNFALTLQASDNNVQVVNQSVQQDGVEVEIKKITVTPMSFIVYYDQLVSKEVSEKWHGIDAEIEIKDDLGNVYPGDGNGGSGDGEGNMSWSETFKKLDPKATKLYITPTVSLWEYTPENHGGVEITEDGEKAISIPTKAGKGREEFTLEEIVVELNK